MIYGVGAGFVAGQLLGVELRALAMLAGGVLGVVALVASWCAGPPRGRRRCAAAAGVALALAVGGALTALVEERPRHPEHVANVVLPWRGELRGVVRGDPLRRPHGTTTALVEAERVGSGDNARRVHGLVRLTM